MAVFAVVPIAATHAAIGLAIRHHTSFGRSGRVLRRTIGIVAALVPIVDELPDVAGHVVQSVAVRAVGALPGLLGTGPSEVGFFLQFSVEKSHRGGPGQWTGAERVLRLRPIGLGGIRVITPGEIEIWILFAAARGVFPLGFGRQPVAAFLKIAGPGMRVVTKWQFLAGAEPVAIERRAFPADAHDGMVVLAVQHREALAVAADAAVGRHHAGFAEQVATAREEHAAIADFDGAGAERGIEKRTVLGGGHRIDADFEAIKAHLVDRCFVAAVLRIDKPVVVAHLEFSGGNRSEDRIGHRCFGGDQEGGASDDAQGEGAGCGFHDVVRSGCSCGVRLAGVRGGFGFDPAGWFVARLVMEEIRRQRRGGGEVKRDARRAAGTARQAVEEHPVDLARGRVEP